MIAKIFIGIAALLAALSIVIAFRPDDFLLTRSATMAAPPAVVFAQVNNFHKWDAWSPWAKLDPNCKVVFEGPESGEGSIFRWRGNEEVGQGNQKIVESVPVERVRISQEFIEPFAGSGEIEFTLKPEGAGTLVTWTMSGKNNFIGKAVSLIIDCENMLGPQFEKGLANLKAIVEAGPKA